MRWIEQCAFQQFSEQVMRWIEQCAYIAASRVGRGGHLLTGAMDGVAFKQPTRVGDILYITAQVRWEALSSDPKFMR